MRKIRYFTITLAIFVIVSSLTLSQQQVPSSENIRRSVWNNQGTQVAVGYADGMLQIWDDQGNLLHTLGGHLNSIEALAWNSSDSLLASASSDLSVLIWSTSSSPWASTPVTFDGFDFVRDLAWNGNQLFGVTANINDLKSYWEWDQQGNVVRSGSLPGGSGVRIAIHPDGTNIAVGTFETISIMDWSDLDVEQNITISESPDNDFISDLAWSADGTRLLSAHLSGYVRIFDTTTTPPTQVFEVLATNTTPTSPPVRGINRNDSTIDVAFGLNENTVVAIGADGTLRQWDVNSQSLLRDTNIGATDTLYGAGISASSKLLVTEGSTQSQIQLTDLNLDPVAAGTASHSIGLFSLWVPPPDDGQEITVAFDASASVDPDGSIVEYKWGTSAGEGSIYTGTQATFFQNVPVSGRCGTTITITFYLTVTDDDGATDTIAVPLQVLIIC